MRHVCGEGSTSHLYFPLIFSILNCPLFLLCFKLKFLSPLHFHVYSLHAVEFFYLLFSATFFLNFHHVPYRSLSFFVSFFLVIVPHLVPQLRFIMLCV